MWRSGSQEKTSHSIGSPSIKSLPGRQAVLVEVKYWRWSLDIDCVNYNTRDIIVMYCLFHRLSASNDS